MTKRYKRVDGQREHRVIAARVLGYMPPETVVVHHIDADGRNNVNTNLVICEDQAYHLLLERRTRALKEFGNPTARKCNYCKQYDLPENLTIRQTQSGVYHKRCHAKYVRDKDHQKQAELLSLYSART